jgi:hypothetical protein
VLLASGLHGAGGLEEAFEALDLAQTRLFDLSDEGSQLLLDGVVAGGRLAHGTKVALEALLRIEWSAACFLGEVVVSASSSSSAAAAATRGDGVLVFLAASDGFPLSREASRSGMPSS